MGGGGGGGGGGRERERERERESRADMAGKIKLKTTRNYSHTEFTGYLVNNFPVTIL